jgi:hypothetical protein
VKLEDLAQAIDLIIVCLIHEFVPLFDLLFHEQTRIAVTRDIADRKINTFFDDELIAANIRHMDLVPPLVGRGDLIFTADRIEKDVIGLFREGKEAQLRIVEEAIDKMELDQRFLFEQLGPVKQDFVVFDIVDVFDLERRHPDLPDDPAGSSPELDIMGSDQSLGQIWIILLLQQRLVGKIKIILVNKAPVETFPFLIERTVAVIWQDPVLMTLYHDAFDIRF